MPAYKIASFENNHLPLIRKVASTGKPLIISTGMARLSELETAVITAKEAGAKDIALLKCTSSYPCPPEFVHLRTMETLRKAFNCEVGFSDHTICGTSSIVAAGSPLVSTAAGKLEGTFAIPDTRFPGQESNPRFKTFWKCTCQI